MVHVQGFLTPDERLALRRVMYRSGYSAQDHVRANAILLLDKGWSVPSIAEAFFLDEQTVRNFLERYREGAIDALLNDDRQGRKSSLSDSQKDRLRRHVAGNLYMDSRLVIEYVTVEFGVSYSSSAMHNLLHSLGFVYKKTKHVPGRADRAAQAEFVRRFKEFMSVKSPDTPVYFIDAVHPTHNSSPAYGWILRGKEKELIANCGRQRLNIHGALNAETHEVIVLDADSVNAEAAVELFRRIDAMNPSADAIYVISDNAGCYHSQSLAEYLQSGASRIRLWHLPPYSPNLNLIERLWGFFRRKVMNNRYYATFKEFSEEALMFFKCLSDYADELRTLLTHNFQLFDNTPEKQVRRAY